MNRLFIIIGIFFITFFACSYTLKGAVSFTVDEARQLAFDGVAEVIDISQYTLYFKDENLIKNKRALLKGKRKYKNRLLTRFSDDFYAVTYISNKYISYYYNPNGELQFIDFTLKKKYPALDVKYDTNGNLVNSILSISSQDQYIFDINKELQSHWIGKNCYNEQGELIITRE